MCKSYNIYKRCVYAIVIILVNTSPVSANVIDIVEYSSFINAAEFGPTSLQHTQIGYSYDDYTGAGMGVDFTNSLSSANYGAVSWKVSNLTSLTLHNVWFFGFLDAHIDETTTSFFNETGDASNLVLGIGSGDVKADAWEIDEPGYLFGDIFTNLLNGALDNTNGLLGIEDDASMALGFDVGTLLPTESILVTFDISLTNNGGLYHYDSVSNFGFYFNGSARILSDSVTIPESSALLLISLGGVLLLRMNCNSSRKTAKI